MKKQLATGFLIMFGILSLLPLIQHFFHPFKLAGLQGAFEKGILPELTTSGWFSGTYQERTDFYLKNNTGFNGELVRLRNQIDYSVFGNINTSLTLGKEGYIFDPNYIYARTGVDLLPDSVRKHKSELIKNVSLFLDSLNIPLLFCIAPNKANYYSEYLPEFSPRSENTNQAYFSEQMQLSGYHVINFDSWFIKLKPSAEFPLIPKYGAHWSTYGAVFAADSILKTISSLKQKPFVTFSIKDYEISNKPRFVDDDYLASLNLMKKWPSPPMAYPKLKFTKGPKPNILVVSDSFIWNFFDLEVIQNCFSEKSQINYYNKTLFNIYRQQEGSVPERLTLADLSDRDIIVIIATGPSLKDFGYNFFEQLNELRLHE